MVIDGPKGTVVINEKTSSLTYLKDFFVGSFNYGKDPYTNSQAGEAEKFGGALLQGAAYFAVDMAVAKGISLLKNLELKMGAANLEKAGTQAIKAYRYVSKAELEVIKKTGKIPNIDRSGNLKNVFVSPGKYDTIAGAENGLQIGKQNPFGPTESPVYRIEFDLNSVRYTYAGNVEGGTGVELITQETIPINLTNIVKLK